MIIIIDKNMRTSRLLLAPLLVSAWVLGLGGISFYTPALISIQQGLHISTTLAKLTISYFILGKAISMLAIAPFADYFQRRRLFIGGLGIFTLGSLICLLCPNIQVLLFGRFIEGLGVSICILMGRSLVNDQFPPNQAANLFSIIFIGNALAITLLPILAGYIVSYFSWRWIFLILSLYGSSIVILFYYFLPKQMRPADAVPSTLQTTFKPFLKRVRLIFINPIFISFMLSLSLIDSGEKILTTLSPFIFINKLGLSQIYFGYLQGSFWCAHLVGLLLCGMLVLRQKLERMIGLGALICLIAVVAMLFACLLQNQASVMLMTIGMFIFMVSTGFIVPTALVGIAKPFPQTVGLATALAMAVEFFMGFILTAVISHIKNHELLLLTITSSIVAMGVCFCWYQLNKRSKIEHRPICQSVF